MVGVRYPVRRHTVRDLGAAVMCRPALERWLCPDREPRPPEFDDTREVHHLLPIAIPHLADARPIGSVPCHILAAALRDRGDRTAPFLGDLLAPRLFGSVARHRLTAHCTTCRTARHAAISWRGLPTLGAVGSAECREPGYALIDPRCCAARPREKRLRDRPRQQVRLKSRSAARCRDCRPPWSATDRSRGSNTYRRCR